MTDRRGLDLDLKHLLADARVAGLLAAADGVPIHLVGGAVRDAGLGRAVHDLDIVVAEAGATIATRLAAATGARLVALGGERFGAIRLVLRNEHIDLWDLQGGSLTADLWRRDFTVNAIAIALPDGTICDPTGGLGDLASRRLRATRPEVFAEDPVRVLRLARFATTLPGFDADTATVVAARAAAPQLAPMPHERLRTELDLIFSRPLLSPSVNWCLDLGLPAFFFGKGGVVAGDAAVSLRQVRRLDDLRSTGADATSGLSDSADAASTSVLALHWSLFTELFSSTHAEAMSRLRDLARRGLVTRACCDAGLKLLASDWELPNQQPARRRWLHSAGPAWRDAVTLRAALADAEDQVAEWRRVEEEFLSYSEDSRAAILSPPVLLSGDEVQALLGIPPGPAVGAALARVRRAQVEGVVRSREEAESLLRAERASEELPD